MTLTKKPRIFKSPESQWMICVPDYPAPGRDTLFSPTANDWTTAVRQAKKLVKILEKLPDSITF